MEPIRRRPQDITPGRPLSDRPATPAGHRAVFSDFTTRPMARPVPNTTRPVTPPEPTVPQTAPLLPHPAVPHHPAPPKLHQLAPQPYPTQTQPIATPQPALVTQAFSSTAVASNAQPQPSNPDVQPMMPDNEMPAAAPNEQRPTRPFAAGPKAPEHRSRTSRAGLIGLVCFAVLAGLLLSPLLPSKTFDSFPGSSQSSSSGDDSLACVHELQQTSATTRYDHKLGSPITYSYATTTTQKATCDNKPLTAVAGHTGQFNPLGLLIDVALALVVSIVVAKIWRRIFSKRD